MLTPTWAMDISRLRWGSAAMIAWGKQPDSSRSEQSKVGQVTIHLPGLWPLRWGSDANPPNHPPPTTYTYRVAAGPAQGDNRKSAQLLGC